MPVHTPPTAKHPDVTLIPPPSVDVAVVVPTKLAATIVPATDNIAYGVDVPIPTFPLASILIISEPEPAETANTASVPVRAVLVVPFAFHPRRVMADFVDRGGWESVWLGRVKAGLEF